MTTEFADIRDVEVFSVGTWKGSKTITVTGEMLDDMVRAFNDLSAKVNGYLPPIKLGHTDAQRFLKQDTGAPALGWVSALRRVGDKVIADFKDVPSSLVDLIRRRLYNSVSIEVMPQVEYAGQTFKNVLSAVAVLGAELPAVKGLKELSASLFDATLNERIVLSEREQGQTMAGEAMYTQAQLDALIEAAVHKAKQTFATEQNAALTAMTAERDAAKTALAAAQAETKTANDKLVNFAAEAAKNEIASVVDQAIKEGKLLPAQKDATLAFAQTLDNKTKIKFGADAKDEMTPLEQWKKSLLGAKPVVKMGEHTHANKTFDTGDKPAATEVADKARAKITAAGGEAKLSFEMAVQQVLSEEPDLKARYVALQ